MPDVTGDGILLMRRPFNEDAIGIDVSNRPIYQRYLHQGSIGTEMLIVAVARSSKEIFAEWRTESFRLSVIGMFMLTLLSIAGVYLIYQILQKEAVKAALEEARLSLESLNLGLKKWNRKMR